VTEAHNEHAGQGAVLLDIGDNIGALVIIVPKWLVGAEIEARPINRPTLSNPPHAAIVPRPTGSGTTYCAVIGELAEGTYLLRRRPNGPVMLRVTVTGGEVCEARWPLTSPR
jgi:hypothetical protein